MAEPEKGPKKKADKNTIAYYAGLIALFSGLALSISVGVALIVLGGVLVIVAVANSYILIFLSRDKDVA